MEIIQIVGLGFIVTLLILIIKQQKPEIAIQLSLALATIIFFIVLGKINVVLNLFRDMAAKANISSIACLISYFVVKPVYIFHIVWHVRS